MTSLQNQMQQSSGNNEKAAFGLLFFLLVGTLEVVKAQCSITASNG